MIFAEALKRLREASVKRGEMQKTTVVQLDDLCELLRHFDRIEDVIRTQHNERAGAPYAQVVLRQGDFDVRWRERDIGGHSTAGTYWDGEWEAYAMDQDGDRTVFHLKHQGKLIMDGDISDGASALYHYNLAKIAVLAAMRFAQGRIMCVELEACGECAYCKRAKGA